MVILSMIYYCLVQFHVSLLLEMGICNAWHLYRDSTSIIPELYGPQGPPRILLTNSTILTARFWDCFHRRFTREPNPAIHLFQITPFPKRKIFLILSHPHTICYMCSISSSSSSLSNLNLRSRYSQVPRPFIH